MRRKAPGEEQHLRTSEVAVLYQLTDSLYRARTLNDIYDAALEAIVSALGTRASILLFDETGVMRFVAWRGLSEHYRTTLSGHSPWRPDDREVDAIFVEDIEATTEPDWIKAEILTEGIRGLAFIPLMAQGRVIGKFMSYHRDRHVFEQSERVLAVTIARQLGFSLERARAEEARQHAESELRESEERFRLMSEQAPVMIWTSDHSGRCLHLNRLLRSFWGLTDTDVPAFDWSNTIHPDDIALVKAAMSEALLNRRPVTVEGRYRNEAGVYRLLSTEATPRFSSSGAFLGMIGVNADVTPQREAEARLRLLVDELNHRVKNTLAVVQGIAHQTFGGSKATDEARNSFVGRLMALASAHTLLTQRNWESAPLHKLATDTLSSQGVEAARYSIEGPPIDLPSRAALALGMALHELGTNAVKYGALSNEEGRIDLTWSILPQDTPRLTITWRESGGPAVVVPERKGFGSTLIERALARDLDASVFVDFRSEGVVCLVEAPVPSGGFRA